jgi:glutaredoxin
MEVTLLYFDDCPNWRDTDRILRRLANEYGYNLTHRQVTTEEEATRVEFRGSPTILVDGTDPFADPDAPTGLSCRVYTSPEGLRGSPTEDMLRGALAL